MGTVASRPSGQGSGNAAHRGWRRSGASAGPCVSEEEEEKGPWRLPCPAPGTAVFAEDVGPVHLWVSCWSCRAVSGERRYSASCSRGKPLDASAVSAEELLRGGELLCRTLVLKRSLSCRQNEAQRPARPPGWLGFYRPSTNKYLFPPLIRTQSLGIVCFKIKFCFGVNCQLLCFRGCLPAWKSLPLPRPRGDSQPHPAPFFGVFLFFGVNVGKCENKSVCFSPGNCSAAPLVTP